MHAMTLPDLLTSLAIVGLRPTLGPDDAIDIVGPVARFTDSQRRGVFENKAELRQLLEQQLECFTKSQPVETSFEESERVAIAFTDTEEGRQQAIGVGNEFVLMAAQDHHTWLWNKIGSIDDVGDLFAFAERFEKDVKAFEVFQPIAEDIRELIASRRANLRQSKPRQGSWEYLRCTKGPYKTKEFARMAERRRKETESRYTEKASDPDAIPSEPL